MKDDFLHKGIQGLRNITLSPEEKRAVLSRLSEYMKQNPPPAIPQKQSAFGWLVPAFRFEYAIASALIVLLAGGSAAVAAEGALPGDMLYPVKVRIAEPLQGIFIVGDVPKARWEAEKTVRRLEEAETLAAQKRLSRVSVQTIKTYFEESTDEFNTIIRNAEAKGLSEALVNESVDFEAEINAHSQILSILKQHADSENADITALQGVVEENVHKAKERRVNAAEVFFKNSQGKRAAEIRNSEGNAPPADREDEARRLFDNRAQSIQLMINETRSRLADTTASIDTAASSSVQKDILERVPRALQQAEDALKDAKEKRDSGDSGKAFSALLDSESATRQADTSLRQGLKFDKEESKNQPRQSGSGSSGSGDGSSGRGGSDSGRHSDGSDR